MPRAQTTAFILSQFKTRGAVHFMGLHEQDYFGSQPDPEKRNITTLPVPQSLYNRPFNESESLYEEIDESQVLGQKSTYTFADPDNCLIEQDEDTPEMKPKNKIYEKLPGNNFTNFCSTVTNLNNLLSFYKVCLKFLEAFRFQIKVSLLGVVVFWADWGS